MNIIVDTNVLVRAVARDDPHQADVAGKLLREATKIIIPTPVLCEFVWVLRKLYLFPPADIAAALRALYATANVEMNRPAVDAGLTVLNAGGDFADGVIAQEGAWLGGNIFASFDRKAVAILAKHGHSTLLLS